MDKLEDRFYQKTSDDFQYALITEKHRNDRHTFKTIQTIKYANKHYIFQ